MAAELRAHHTGDDQGLALLDSMPQGLNRCNTLVGKDKGRLELSDLPEATVACGVRNAGEAYISKNACYLHVFMFINVS